MSTSWQNTRTVRLSRPWTLSFRYQPRTLVVLGTIVALTLVLAWLSLINGNNAIGVEQVWQTITGQADASTVRSITQWRLPRILFALIAGAGLAASGAVFQSLTRNPLGSPDVIGFSTGAYTGALLVAWSGLSGIYTTALGALCGGLVTASAVYLLSRRSGTSGLMLIVVGIAVGMFLNALNTYIIAHLKLAQALVAATWGAGSLASITWPELWITFSICVLTLPLLLALAPAMSRLEMGDDTAHAVGVHPERTRLLLLIGAVLLVSGITAFAGPIAFVALAAPQLAKRLTRSPNVQVFPAAIVGGFLLLSCDLVARTLLAPKQLPTGLVTLVLGGIYLVWLLASPTLRRKV